MTIDLSTARPHVLHDLRIACLNTYNMKAISLHYDITEQLSDLMVIAICIGMIDK